MKEFKKGDKIRLVTGGEITIISKLGEGGQGIVYKVQFNGKEYALKWYFIKTIKEPDKFYDNLNNNATKGSPSSEFLWPLAVTEKQRGSFGYIMDLRPPEYKDFTHFLNALVRYKSTDAVLNAALNMINAFQALHRKGYSYQDLNDGNFFINPDNGDILICDNDNVAPYGESFGIGGKSRYMAPEVVLGTTRPNLDTDLFSLSVVLFMLMFIAHPLEGAKVVGCPCLTEESEVKFYASEPIFVFDPSDASNRPVRGIHNNIINLWPQFPTYLHDAFIRSFVVGAKDKHSRLRESEWKKIFLQLKDDMILCPKCGEENFASLNNNGVISCSNCSYKIDKPLSLVNNDFNIVLYPNKMITEWHIANGDNTEIIGTVVQNKNNPNLWGIRNLSDKLWIVRFPNNDEKIIKKNEVTPVLKDISVEIGKQCFVIK